MTNNKEAAAKAIQGIGTVGKLAGSGMLASTGLVMATVGVAFGSVGAIPIVLGPLGGNVGFSVEYVKGTWKLGAMAWSLGAIGIVMMGAGTAGVSSVTNKNSAPPILSTIEKVEGN